MAVDSTKEVTELLQKWSGGDAAALEELTPLIYAELHASPKAICAANATDTLCKRQL
jgi:hypothetical protein